MPGWSGSPHPLKESARVARHDVALEVAARRKRGALLRAEPILEGWQNSSRPFLIGAHCLDVDATVLNHEEPANRHELREVDQRGLRGHVIVRRVLRDKATSSAG